MRGRPGACRRHGDDGYMDECFGDFELIERYVANTFAPLSPIAFIISCLTSRMEVLDTNTRTNSRFLPLCIERLVKEGYTIDIEYSKKLVRITCSGNELRGLIPFGQTRLTEFGGWFSWVGLRRASYAAWRIAKELSAFRRASHIGIGMLRLMNMARQHASSCTVAPLLDPMDAAFLPALIEQQKEIKALRACAEEEGAMQMFLKRGSAMFRIYR